MITITPYGRTQYQDAVNRIPAQIHLYTDAGELTGFGYAPKRFDFNQWKGGDYPEFVWVFENGEGKESVLGHYVTDSSGQVIFSDSFDEPYVVEKKGDRIAVVVNQDFIGAIGN